VSEPQLLEIESLRVSPTAALFQGTDHGGIPATSFIVDTPPGMGPTLHVHPYPEVFIVLKGHVTFRVGDRTIEAHGGQIVIGPASTPHKFTNTGTEPLSIVSIHPNDHLVQDAVDE
jgi:mannose-6-phosphate isomerase-like protein (cupin superfamily)